MNILVIPEDFRKDQFVLEPIIGAMATNLARPGRHTLKVKVCWDPILQGVSEALKWERIQDIFKRYPMVDLFLLCIDRDGQPGRRDSLDRLEKLAEEFLSQDRVLIGENAHQELEVWVLAGCDLPHAWSWPEIRSEVDLKEIYFDPYTQQRGLMDSPGGGRKLLAQEAARHYRRVRQLCPEDIGNLESRIQAWIGD